MIPPSTDQLLSGQEVRRGSPLSTDEWSGSTLSLRSGPTPLLGCAPFLGQEQPRRLFCSARAKAVSLVGED